METLVLDVKSAAGDDGSQVPRRELGTRGANDARRRGGPSMRLISRDELKKQTESSGDLRLLFVLGEWQYRAAHIPGSANLPCSTDLYKSKGTLKGLEPDDEIVVYCSSKTCWASIAVYHYLVSRGYTNVRRYAGGLEDWERAGYPLDGEMAASRTATVDAS
jgi:rhodanese-related sulfurtransferase